MGIEGRVVVLAHPRSGSNSLVEVLDRHPQLSMCNEPFNDQHVTWREGNSDYTARLGAGEDFDDLIDEIFARWTGLKSLSYQHDDDCLARLLDRPEVSVIALRRRNLLETAVSQLVAEQTSLWKTWDARGPLEDHYRDLAPLDLELLAERIRWTAAEVARVDGVLEELEPSRVLRVVYEDVYRAAPAEQDAWLGDLWAFLDLAPCDGPEVRHYLSDAVQLARPSTYGRLPNVDQIESTLGSDVTGHLDWHST